MALNPGSKLGSYEITSLLGKGGMGEVYRAKDPKLKRDVAIKILPDEFSSEPEWISRFQREAEVLASLNHHHIASIYDLQQIAETRFLILELVEGDTLADILKRRGALPLDDALNIGKQICEALEAAHERGIIHRDLKPANVKVDSNGNVKVLDFGLAKAFAPHHVNESVSNSPTLSVAATNAGVILGTASYMSPEQARGRTTDRRTDVWAFGCVLYEMLTGKQAFHGEDVTEILASVVKSDPDWQALPPGIPANIRTLLHRCLQKDIKKRTRDAGDIAIELEHAPAPAEPTRAPVLSTRSLVMTFVGLLLGGLIAGIVVWRMKPPTSVSVNRLTLTLPTGQRLAGLDMTSITFAPDGKSFVFVGQAGGVKQLYLREFDNWQTKPIPGTEGAVSPFFSPDGKWIAFFTLDRLKKVSIAGGPPVILAGVTNSRGGSWGSDGNIVFAPSFGTGLSLVPSGGGTVQPLSTHDEKKGERGHRFPHHLANTGLISYTVGTGGSWDDARIEVLNPETGAKKVLIEGGSDARYSQSGHLVYLRAGTLMAVRFNLPRLEISGAPLPLVEGLLPSTDNTGAAQAAVSELGSLAYVSGDRRSSDRTFTWVDRKGVEEPVQLPPRFYRHPRISPDGKRAVLDIDEGNKSDLWFYDFLRGTLTRKTFDGISAFGTWTPDGTKVTFQSNEGNGGAIAWVSAEGGDPAEQFTASKNNQYVGSWSADGQTFLFVELDPNRGRDLWMLKLKEGRKLQPFLQTPFNETNPAFSPDGRWLAYQSDESGRDEVYVQSFSGPGTKVLVSTEGGTEPVWSADAHELFYRAGDKMMTVAITSHPTFHPSKPEVLFERPYLMGFAYPRNYDVTPDGRRFLMIKENEQVSAATVINIVLNWYEELKQKLPN